MSNSDLIELLKNVPDPEVPVLNIIDLGIVREASSHDDIAEITITPTYTGCPAMKVIEDEITKLLKNSGFTEVKIKTVLAPAWTTDWLTDEGKEKLLKYGIAPPVGSADKNSLFGEERIVKCPQCGSSETKMISQFGSTACKALYKCSNCGEPFDYFKCI